MANKTPIQELIDLLEAQAKVEKDYKYVQSLSDIASYCRRRLEKEKAFAFDCFKAGYWSRVAGETPFEQFYEEYASQHNE